VIVRGDFLAETSDEEYRHHVQARLAFLSKLLFWGFVILSAFSMVIFEAARVRTEHTRWIGVIGGTALAMLALIWRGLLVRRRLTLQQLFAIDMFYAAACGIVFAAAAILAKDLKATTYPNLLWVCFVVFLRAIIVPSTGPRTTVFAVMAFAPICAASIAVAEEWAEWIPQWLFIGGTIFVGVGVSVLAAIGSRTIYGLRRQVHQVMQLGQYTLDRKIGEGGMGTVYLGHHALLKRPTAIKLLQPGQLDEDALRRFEREVQHMAQLTHANTVAVFDYGRSADGVFYYAMEYLGGGVDLDKLVRNYGAQPWGRVVHILDQVCRALQEAHDHAIVHRDIKPANIIVCERGGEPDVVKVVDYGLAKEIKRDGEATTQVIVGTPAFVAPEAVTDPDSVGPAADLYALGGVAFYLLTGKRLFEGKNAVELCVQHVTATPRAPSSLVEIPVALDALILACLAKQPSERPASARAITSALRALPPAPDWSDAKARQWWEAHRKALAAVDSAAETRSMRVAALTIDLSQRTPSS
jgi:serine/threonine-protein kinase